MPKRWQRTLSGVNFAGACNRFSTRFPPTTRKTTSETIYQVVRKHGLMDALLKPAFISQVPDGNVTYAGCARLTTLGVSSS